MKNVKGILSIVGLLALGFIGGFFTHRQVTIKQVEKVREIGHAPGFQRQILHFLEPTTEQREQLEPIIQNYAQKMGDQMREHRQERKLIVDAMHQEIKPFLTDEQILKLENFTKRFRDRKDRKKPRRPRDPRPERTGVEN